MAKQQAQTTTSDFNLDKLSPAELEQHVAATIQVGGNIAIFGRRGTGKTQICKQQIPGRAFRQSSHPRHPLLHLDTALKEVDQDHDEQCHEHKTEEQVGRITAGLDRVRTGRKLVKLLVGKPVNPGHGFRW